MTKLKKKIPAPLTEEQLKEKLQGADPYKVILPAHSAMPKAEKISKDEVTEEKFSFVTVSSVGFNEDQTGIDGTGKEHNFPGGMFVYFNWSVPGFGFGELTIKKQSDGKVVIDSEGLGKDFVKTMLCSLVDEAEVK